MLVGELGRNTAQIGRTLKGRAVEDRMGTKSKDRIKLEKIEIDMGDIKAKLTIEQARELCALLKGLFGDDSTKIVHVRDYWYPRPWYMGPSWTYTGSSWSVDANTTTGTYTVNLCNS
jgi:hypothetical protein